jgi:hypothetical protein
VVFFFSSSFFSLIMSLGLGHTPSFSRLYPFCVWSYVYFTTSRGVWCSYSRCLLTPYTEWKIKNQNQNYFLPTIVDAVCNIATMPTVSMLSIS